MPGLFPAPIFSREKALGTGLFTLPRALSHEPLKTHALKIQMQRKPSWITGSGVTFNVRMELNQVLIQPQCHTMKTFKQTNKTSNLTSDFFVGSFQYRLLKRIISRLVLCQSTRNSFGLYEEIQKRQVHLIP